MTKATRILGSCIVVLFFGTGCSKKSGSSPICNNIASVQLSYDLTNGIKMDTTINDATFLKEFSHWFGQMKAVDKDSYSAKTNYFLIVGNVKCREGNKKFMM